MESQWISHVLGDGDALCTIDMGFAESCPDATRPLFTYVRIEFKDPGEGGFGTPEERSVLGDFEDAMTERSAEHNAVHFASVRYGGLLDVLFYSPADAEKPLVAIAREVCLGYDVEVSSKKDAEWDAYQKLFPPPEAITQSYDMQILHALEAEGDSGGKERPVDHALNFPDQASADKAAKRAEAMGYAESDRYEDEGQELPVTLQLTKTHDLQPETIAAARDELTALADELGGEYDGWETPVVR